MSDLTKFLLVFFSLPFLIILPIAVIGGLARLLFLRYVLPRIVKANTKAFKEGMKE